MADADDEVKWREAKAKKVPNHHLHTTQTHSTF